MLEPLRHILDRSTIVLASASPRRKEILQNILKLDIHIRPSNAEENLDKKLYDGKPFDYTMDTAALKSEQVWDEVAAEFGSSSSLLVVSCDTVVTQHGIIYEKPRDKEDAFRMLSSFSGGQHQVYSGVKLVWRPEQGEKREVSFYEGTQVDFAAVSTSVIRGYIETGEPMDKAGGYGIQGVGASLVRGIQGDYFNVMGFPVHRFAEQLTKLLGPESFDKKQETMSE